MPKKRKSTSKKRKAKKRAIKILIFKWVFILIIFIGIALGGFIYSVYIGLWGKLPRYEELRNIQNAEASELYSEDGVLMGKYFIENRTNIGFGHITTHTLHALIATEDVRFYEHKGFDRVSMFRVLFKTLLLGDRSSGGGSTISQQLAKNLYPREEHDVTFMPVIKIKEILTAYRIENLYNKQEILTLYLNTVSFGERTFGIESAAQKYFSISASELSTEQAATLIGMLKGPSRYNPRIHPERALKRRNTVINQMVKYEFLAEKEGELLKKRELNLKYKEVNHYTGLAPYIREKIRTDAAKIIEQYNRQQQTDYNLYQDGLIITSTIDAEMQQYAEESVASHMKQLQHQFYTHWGNHEPWQNSPAILDRAIKSSSAYLSLKKQGLPEEKIMEEMGRKKSMFIYDSYQGEVQQEMSSIDSIKHYLKILHPGVIAVEPQTGKVKVWVGGVNHKYFQYDQVTAPRQVGSVFKPIVYSAAIHYGAKLNTYYKNEQKNYPEYNNWSPRNSDNDYTGFYTLKGALSKSINTIAVDVLLETGIEKTIVHAHNLGIHSDLPQYPSLALGVADIPLYEMIKPYTVFAGGGRLIEPYYIKEIKDKNGVILYQSTQNDAKQVLTQEEANVMSNILQAAINEGTGQRIRNNYHLHNDLAGKTGTTQNHADGWFIGYNPRIVIGVRVGANDINVHFNSINLGQGANMALPIFGMVMQKCLQSEKQAYWKDLTFPMLTSVQQQELKYPVVKESVSSAQDPEDLKLRHSETQPSPQPQEKKEKKGFFRRIFGKKR
ncbi:transglycosylase domain-containing protein [Porphyromonadaceae bacterium OttesenSCG-928-L07]|nr:transglycosylase domain-containing protein [Porphyromonadaceae bacterium OttesenSCG-928-L07]